MARFARDFTVTGITFPNPGHFVLALKSPIPLPEMTPGQFAEVLVKDSPATFLRRPFSIHDVDHETNTLFLLIKKVGPATHKLSGLVPGDTLNLVFPLGKGFTLPAGKKAMLVGGGCGVAPLRFLARYLAQHGITVEILIGAAKEDDMPDISPYTKWGTVYLTSEDGSCGEQGFVTQHSVFTHLSRSIARIYACGPDPMMKAVARIAIQQGIDCEVSLEHTMACGIGACLCCVVLTTEGNQCVCTEGPVFNTKKLQWQI